MAFSKPRKEVPQTFPGPEGTRVHLRRKRALLRALRKKVVLGWACIDVRWLRGGAPPHLVSHMWLFAQGVKMEDRDGKAQSWETINLYVMNDYLVKPLTWTRQVCANSCTTINQQKLVNQSKFRQGPPP
eukprot:5982723-Amphidinium_carterae.3